MDEAMYHDIEAWRRFTEIEARRIKQFLGLPEQTGLEVLAQALPLRLAVRNNAYDLHQTEHALVYRVLDCRVQTARSHKGMALPPSAPLAWWNTQALPESSVHASPAAV